MLAGFGAAGRFRRRLSYGSEPWRYYLAPAGAALIATERGQPAPVPRLITRRALALAASQRLDHLLGVNGFFTALAAAARASNGSYALVGKLAQYADLATAGAAGVLVLYWLPSSAREAALRPALERAQAGAVTVATAVPGLGGPAGPVWLPLGAARRAPLASLCPATSWEGR